MRSNALASSQPEDLDAGEGAELLLSMLSSIIKDTRVLVDLLDRASQQMYVTVDLYRGVEEESEQVFRELGEQIP